MSRANEKRRECREIVSDIDIRCAVIARRERTADWRICQSDSARLRRASSRQTSPVGSLASGTSAAERPTWTKLAEGERSLAGRQGFEPR
jgi:hypothetical protein